MLVERERLGLHRDLPSLPGHVESTGHVRFRDAAGWSGAVLTRRPGGSDRGPAVLYFPGRWQNGSAWAVAEPCRDHRVHWARHGFPVVTVRSRVAALQAPEHEAGLASCTTADLVDDAVWAARVLSRELRPTSVIVAGYSLGAALACLALAGAHLDLPTIAVVLIDGGVPSTGYAAARRVPSPPLAENPAADRRFLLWARAMLAGETRARIPGAGDREAVRSLLTADRWWPGRQLDEMREIADGGGLAGADPTKSLAALRLPALAVAATGPRGRDEAHRGVRSARLIAGARSRVLWCDGWSHTDVLVHRSAARQWFGPAVRWMAGIASRAS